MTNELPGFDNVGSEPYPGIAKDTCRFHFPIKGKQILLIDDIYTIGCNVDEDFIQALYDLGASKVFFYAIGRTVKNILPKENLELAKEIVINGGLLVSEYYEDVEVTNRFSLMHFPIAT